MFFVRVCLLRVFNKETVTQPYNHTMHPGVSKLHSVFIFQDVVSADTTISSKLFHTITILGAKENFLKS